MASTYWSGTQAFTVPAGSATVVPIRMPYRGILSGYNLVQTSGANTGATAKLLSSNQAAAPNSTYPEDSFLVTSIALTSGQASVAAHDIHVAYQNQDGDPSNGQRFLYLKITPAGSGDKSFALTVTVATPIL